MEAKMITTALELPGYEIVENIGIVRGIVVRSRSIVGNLFGGLQTVFGGNITIYTNMCEAARKDAYRIMCAQADSNKANAIIGMKYDATEVMRGVTEVLCYGTAVVVRKKAS
ncbi:MAG TPA: YbjQ family protein [Aquabacterium sp.]|nr:YbjQ family protein [Aquabacterium sp.]